jgi:putative spermidine/putrescine transport system ATP-binding protein
VQVTPWIRVAALTKRFGSINAVKDVSFEVGKGEFVSLLGPSGCGKTTTLRCIGGYERSDEGTIEIGGKIINDVPVHRRDIGMVFQSYALFPHKTVGDNVAFPLKMRGVASAERRTRVADALRLVDLTGYDQRYPSQLSAGQRQRVALARALIYQPSVLLLDEPLANLDRRLRQMMRVELKLIQQKVGISTLFVTHDQDEALVMSDRIAVMEGGRIHQFAAPSEIYHRPATSFVATFIGETNLLRGQVMAVDADVACIRVNDDLMLTVQVEPESTSLIGRTVAVSIRPERINIAAFAATDAPNRCSASVEFVTYLGATASYRTVTSSGQRFQVTQPISTDRAPFSEGDNVVLCWDPGRARVLG